jgi:hypothetical protein
MSHHTSYRLGVLRLLAKLSTANPPKSVLGEGA